MYSLISQTSFKSNTQPYTYFSKLWVPCLLQKSIFEYLAYFSKVFPSEFVWKCNKSGLEEGYYSSFRTPIYFNLLTPAYLFTYNTLRFYQKWNTLLYGYVKRGLCSYIEVITLKPTQHNSIWVINCCWFQNRFIMRSV